MDLSKLPRLSQTPPPPPGQNPDAPPEPPIGSQRGFPVIPAGGQAGAPVGSGAAAGVPLYCRCGAQLAPGMRFCSNCGADFAEATGSRRSGEFGGFWLEALLSIGIGVFLLLMMPRGIQYWTTTMRGGTFTPYLHPSEPGVYVDFERFQNPATGAITDYKYRDRFEHFWSDTAVTAFALALILEGIIFAVVRNRWVILGAAMLIVAATVLNLWYVIGSYTRVNPITRTKYGLPPYSALAVIFGIVMAGYLIRLFYALSPRRR